MKLYLDKIFVHFRGKGLLWDNARAGVSCRLWCCHSTRDPMCHSRGSMVKWSLSGGEGAALPSTLQGVSIKQGIREAACVLFLLYARWEEQPNWSKDQGKFCDFFFSLLSAVSALQLLKLCAGKVRFNSRRVITRKIRDPDGRKMI